MKTALRGKLIVLHASKKKQERAYTSSLMAHKLWNKKKLIHPGGEENRKSSNSGLKSSGNKENHTKNQQIQELVL